MPYYSYHAIDQTGTEKNGTISAPDKSQAIDKLKAMHLYPTKIFQVDKNYSLPHAAAPQQVPSRFPFLARLLTPRIKQKEIVTFIRDLSVLIESDLPIIRSLRILRQQALSSGMKKIIAGLEISVESGQTLSESLKQYPELFPELFLNMIRAGELGGGQVLSDVLKRLALLCESAERLNARIKAALTYPLFVLAFALIIMIVLVTFILPKFLVIYEDLNLKLPFITQLVFTFVHALRNHWLAILIAAFSCGIGFGTIKRNRHVSFLWDRYKLRIPVLGSLFLRVALSRFSRTLGTLLHSGVPILQALSIVREATGNRYIAMSIDKAHNSIREGESIAGPLAASSVFPPLVTNMIALGEESGNVSTILIKIADKYDEEIETTVLQLTSLLEPFLILLLGIIVVFVIIALFLPLVTLMQGLSA